MSHPSKGRKMDPEMVRLRNEKIKAFWNKPESKKLASEISLKAFSNPAMKEKHRASVSKAIKKKWSEATPEQREAQLRNWIKAGHDASSDITISSIEIKIQNELDKLGLLYETQKYIGQFRVDFYLPKSKLIIECDGDYWHSRPGIPERDQSRDAYHIGRGFKVLRLTESAINMNIGHCVDLIKASL